MLFKKEIFITFDMAALSDVKSRLDAAGIGYYTKTNCVTNPDRHHGAAMSKTEYSYEYRLYVKRKDYETACKAISV